MKSEDLEAWKEVRMLVKGVYGLASNRDLVRDFGITGQTERASVSIMSNITERFERSHVQEKLRFYNVARSSSAEVRSLTYAIEDNFPTSPATTILVRSQRFETGKTVTGLIQSTERRRSGKGLPGLLLSLSAIF